MSRTAASTGRPEAVQLEDKQNAGPNGGPPSRGHNRPVPARLPVTDPGAGPTRVVTRPVATAPAHARDGRGSLPAPARLLTVEEAADYLSVSVRFIRRIIHERRIPVVRLGRHVRLAEPDLEAFVAAGRQPAVSLPPRP